MEREHGCGVLDAAGVSRRQVPVHYYGNVTELVLDGALTPTYPDDSTTHMPATPVRRPVPATSTEKRRLEPTLIAVLTATAHALPPERYQETATSCAQMSHKERKVCPRAGGCVLAGLTLQTGPQADHLASTGPVSPLHVLHLCSVVCVLSDRGWGSIPQRLCRDGLVHPPGLFLVRVDAPLVGAGTKIQFQAINIVAGVVQFSRWLLFLDTLSVITFLNLV